MTDYTKLVEALRCKRDDCEGCDLAFFDEDEGWMCQYAAKDDDAAAAIEDLEGFLSEAERDRDEYEERMRKEQERVLDLQARLEEAENSVERWKDMYLTKHEPKLGKWIGKSDDDSLVKCSVCGHIRIGSSLWYCKQYVPYCENCGAKMEVQE